jgi:hypothetical protein
MSGSVKSIIATCLALLLSLAATGPVRAAEVDDRAAKVAALEKDAARLAGERQAMATVYAQRTAAIAALKAEPSSWARDRKLGPLLAESKDMAARLDAKDQELRALGDRLTAERKALVEAIDRELAATAPPPDEARATQLLQLKTRLGGLLKPLRVPALQMEPGDDAEDLDYKAAALAQGERSLLQEHDRLIARATWFHKQAKLARSRTRADEQDVFGDEEPRHGRTPAARAGGSKEGTNSDASQPPTGTGPSTASGPPGSTTPGTGGTTQFTGDPRSFDLAADPSVILAEVVAAGTLDELRRAERSGDPEAMARAAEHARKEVEERAARLRAQRLEMERRARELRGESK